MVEIHTKFDIQLNEFVSIADQHQMSRGILSNRKKENLTDIFIIIVLIFVQTTIINML